MITVLCSNLANRFLLLMLYLDLLSQIPMNQSLWNDNIAFIAIKDDRLQEIKSATERDENLMKLKTVIMNGWPPHRASLPSALTLYHDYHDELTVQDGIILQGHRVIIPTSMHREIKEKVHAGTPGNQLLHQKSKRHGILAGCVKGNSPIR